MLNRIGLVVTAAAAISNSGAQASRDMPLVGQWSGESYVGGTTGVVTMMLFANGTYSLKALSISQYGWTMDGNTLLLAPTVSQTDTSVSYGKASAIQVEFQGDSMIASAKGQKISLKRVTLPVKDAPLLGRWEGVTDTNELMTQDFTADGRLIVSVTLSREAGRYSIDEDMIKFEQQIPQPGRRKSRFKLSDGKLILYMSPRLPPLELAKP